MRGVIAVGMPATRHPYRNRQQIDKLGGNCSSCHPASEDARMLPGDYAPVTVMENGRRIIKRMRFQCRPEGTPASFDRQHLGTYNAMGALLTGMTA